MSDGSTHPAHIDKSTTVALGLVVTFAAILGSLLVYAGISWDRQQQMERRQDNQDARITKLEDSNQVVGNSLVELKTLMHTVIQNQKRMQDQQARNNGSRR